MSNQRVAMLDTDTWSLLVFKRDSKDPRVPRWRRAIEGYVLCISAQTRGEVLYGALRQGWCGTRMAAVRRSLDAMTVLHPTEGVVEAWARLRSDCSASGHSLHQKQHMGDAWVAATAIAHRLPLLAGDQIFESVPGLPLLSVDPDA